jgi:hypothetical protein
MFKKLIWILVLAAIGFGLYKGGGFLIHKWNTYATNELVKDLNNDAHNVAAPAENAANDAQRVRDKMDKALDNDQQNRPAE